jgi:hypothetical protein
VKTTNDEFVPTRIWRAWIDYHKVNACMRKDYFLRPFIWPMVEPLAGHEYSRQPCGMIQVTWSDCSLVWEVWLKIKNLALVGGNPYSFPNYLILFVGLVFVVFFRINVCHSSLEEHSPTLCPTCIALSVLYFWSH